MKEADEINAALLAPFDPSLIDDKQGKRYIGHEHIRMRVIQATGNCFEWDVSSIEYRADGVSVRTDREKKNKYPATVMIVSGTLTIPGLGRRNGTGVQVLEGNMGEDGYKMAESDAFKRAAMAFGVGLEQLYMHLGPTSSHTTTTPKTARQHDEKPAPEPMTDKQFDEEVRQALVAKDSQRYLQLVDDHAGEMIGRWLVLINQCESLQALEWLERRIAHKGIKSPGLPVAIKKRRGELEAMPAEALF